MNGGLKDIPFSGGSQRVRDQVLVILSEDFPLTVKKLFGRVSKQGVDVTYQAVHKVVQQLLAEEIVEKKEGGIQLSKQWIRQVKDYAITVDTVYTTGKHHRLPKTFDKSFSITFDNFSTYVVWIAECLRDGKFTQGKKGYLYGVFYHPPFPLRFNFIDFELLRQMAANHNVSGFCSSDMPFDRWIATHYKLGGIRGFKTGVKMKLEGDHYVAGDMVIRATFSPETMAFLDKMYAKISDLKQLFQLYLTNVEKKETMHIEVTVERNPTLARMIENQVKQVLEEGEKRAKR